MENPEKLEQEINKSVELLNDGKILLYPTDSIWGIGCDATNSKAIKRIFDIKRRNIDEKMIIIVDSVDKIKEYVEHVPPITKDLIKKSSVPITIVFQNAKNLPKIAISNDGTVAIRVVSGKYSGELLRRFGKPVISTSANYSGEPAALMFNDIVEGIKNDVDYVVSVFQNTMHAIKPSTVIKFVDDSIYKVLRP